MQPATESPPAHYPLVLWPSLQLLGGLILPQGGGEALVAGAGIIAAGLGVPRVVVGLMVVAFGTSAPESLVGVTGTATGAGGVAFGDVVRANIINIAFTLGMTATIRPLVVHRTIMTREIPMLLLAMSAAMGSYCAYCSVLLAWV